MGFHHSTYFAYGTHIPTSHAWDEADRIDTVLARVWDICPAVGHLTAGDYDRDRLFLVTHSTEVSLGAYEHVTPDAYPPEQIADWTRQIAAAADALGYTALAAPGWLVVPDLS
ncbi:hypothetical protein GT204_07815 [Streptomyces sp. SID4919]|uniref:hypothetical protein n=1 Tax=unclassified Streptomyces TaxID=2593676 RepID=UPI000823E341|nr:MULTISPECIES: hypothetical protein [unclassified Streptomyces]MYY08811.1 hypothetical protein [Streptomyces sp. SID4919]SCK25469.1 hypothetical protein YW7DRAFT_01946 [Streptomyces sp. AmelKG-E11A]